MISNGKNQGGNEMRKSVKVLLSAAIAMTAFLTVGKVDSKAAVTGVKQTEGRDTSISLSWNAELGAKSYAVQLSNDGNNWVTMDKTSSADGDVSNITAGRTYYARVGAFNCYTWQIGEGNNINPISGWSSAVEVVTAPDTSNLSVIQTGATTKSITVKCTGASGANYYILSTGSYNNFNKVGASTKNTIKTSSKLNIGTSYTIYCYPCRKAKTTGFIARDDCRSVYGAKTLSNKVSTKNFGFKNIWYNIDEYSIGINSYAAVGDYDGVQVQLQSPSGKGTRTFLGSGDSASIGNFNGTFYRYRIRTYITCGNKKKLYSAWSGFRYAGVSSKITAEYTKSHKIKLNWAKVKNASKFTVYISRSENSGFKKVKTTNAKNRSVVISKCGKSRIKKYTRYYIKIVASAKSGKKTYSSDLINTTNLTVY